MKLFYSPGACSLAPHIILRETGLPFTLERVDTKTHLTQAGVDFYSINPKGYVPVLQLDNGEYLSEGPVIVQYLCDRAAREDLMPKAGSMARYRVMEWQNYITAELHKAFSPLFNPSTDVATKSASSAAVAKKLGWVSSQLRNKQYLSGDTFTGADAYLFVVSNWAGYVGIDLSPYEDLQSFRKRVAERPAVRETISAEGLKA